MRKILDLPERICDCGCARHFKPTRGNQRFFEPACRKRFHAEEMVAVRREDLKFFLQAYWWKSEFRLASDQIKIHNRLRAALEKK